MKPLQIDWIEDEPGLERRSYRQGSVELFVWCRYYASGKSLESNFTLHHGSEEWTRVTIEGFALHADVDTASEWAFVWIKGTMTLYRVEGDAEQRTMIDAHAAMPVRELHDKFVTWSSDIEEPIRKAVLLRLSEGINQLAD